MSICEENLSLGALNLVGPIQLQSAPVAFLVTLQSYMGNRTEQQVFDASNAPMRAHSSRFNTLSRLTKEIAAVGTAAVTTTRGVVSTFA